MNQDPLHGREATPNGRRLWYLLFVIPFVAMLLPQTYNGPTPSIAGLPFFYGYQLLWVVLTGLLTLAVYALTR